MEEGKDREIHRDRSEQAAREEEAQAKKHVHHVPDLLAKVRDLGRYPKEQERSENPCKEAERTLARKLYEARVAGLLKPAKEEELEKMCSADAAGKADAQAVQKAERVANMLAKVSDMSGQQCHTVRSR